MKFSVILKYLQAFGWLWVWLSLAAYLGQNLVGIGQNLWLSAWVKEAKHMSEFTEWEQIRSNKLNIYGLLGLMQGKKKKKKGPAASFFSFDLAYSNASVWHHFISNKIYAIFFKYFEIIEMHMFLIHHI